MNHAFGSDLVFCEIKNWQEYLCVRGYGKIRAAKLADVISIGRKEGHPLPYFPRSILRWLESCATRVFEKTGGHRSEDEPADVRQISYTAGLYLGHSAGVYQLNEEPDADQERRRNERDLPEDEDKEDCLNSIARVRHDERSHHGRDRSTGAQIGHS